MSARSQRKNWWEEFSNPRTVIAFLILYCAIHFLIRYLLTPNYTLDESEQMLFSQSLQWGYRFRHPPLITWLSWATLTFTGGSRAAFFFLKYAIMALGFTAYFAAARIAIKNVRLSALATFGLMTTFAIGYLPLIDLMHTVLLTTMLGAYLWAISRVIARGTPRDYLLHAAIIGLGILAKYVFAVLPIACFIAIAFTPRFRERVKIGPFIFSLILAAAIVAPYAWWAATHEYSLFALAKTITHGKGTAFDPLGWLEGVGGLFIAFIGFLLPFLAIYPFLYWPACKPLRPQEPEDTAWLRFYEITMIAGMTIMLGSVFFVGTEEFKERWMHQVAMAAPIYLFLRVRIANVPDVRSKIFVGIALVFAFGVAIARFAIYETHAKSCKECREYWPMQSFARAFQQAGFDRGTVLAPTYDLAGNLRSVFPDSRLVTQGYPVSVFGPPVPGSCLVVWEGSNPLPKDADDYLHDNFGVRVADAVTRGDVDAALLTSKSRLDHMNYAIITKGRCARP